MAVLPMYSQIILTCMHSVLNIYLDRKVPFEQKAGLYTCRHSIWSGMIPDQPTHTSSSYNIIIELELLYNIIKTALYQQHHIYVQVSNISKLLSASLLAAEAEQIRQRAQHPKLLLLLLSYIPARHTPFN